MDIVAFSDEQVDRAAAGMVAIEGGDARAGGADPAAPGRGAGVALTTFARRRTQEETGTRR